MNVGPDGALSVVGGMDGGGVAGGGVVGVEEVFPSLEPPDEPCEPVVEPPAGEGTGEVPVPGVGAPGEPGEVGAEVKPLKPPAAGPELAAWPLRAKSTNSAPPVAVPATQTARSDFRLVSAGEGVWDPLDENGAASAAAARNFATVIFSTQGSER